MILEVSQRKHKTGPGLPWWLSDLKNKNPPTNAGDVGLSPSLGRFHMLRGN